MRRVGVIGCGLMGSGIAQVCAQAGLDVLVIENDLKTMERARDLFALTLERAQERGKIRSASETLQRVAFSAQLKDLADRELVLEAAIEDETVKLDLFSRVDEVLAPSAILASNTSAIPIARLASATERPELVMGVHFFNPVPVLGLVELVPSLRTAAGTVSVAKSFVEEQLGKTAIVCKDRSGFVVNALLVPFILSAIRMLESGTASATDIDNALVLGAAHPQGPLALADLIGLDTVAAIAQSLYSEYRDPAFAPPPLLSRLVESGMLGRKSGSGFHAYH